MKKLKLSIDDLKVESFLTLLIQVIYLFLGLTKRTLPPSKKVGF